MSQYIPWDELAERYYQGLSVDTGHPAKDARCVIAAVIIKHKLSLSDVETVQQIQENPCLQFFIGLASFVKYRVRLTEQTLLTIQVIKD